MDVKNFITKLIDVFDDEIQIYRKLLDVSISEFDFLVARDFEAIENHVKLKESFFKEINNLEESRSSIILKLEKLLATKIESVSDLLESISDQSLKAKVSEKRSILSILINRIKEANARNSDFIEHSKYLFTNVVSNFNDLINKNSAKTYSKKGKINKEDKNASLMLNKEV